MTFSFCVATMTHHLTMNTVVQLMTDVSVGREAAWFRRVASPLFTLYSIVDQQTTHRRHNVTC